jgi:hypothetical protein
MDRASDRAGEIEEPAAGPAPRVADVGAGFAEGARSRVGPVAAAALGRAVRQRAPLSNRGIGRMLQRETGYGYEFSDDPLSAGGFGPGDATIRVKPGPVRTTLIRRQRWQDQLDELLPGQAGILFLMQRDQALTALFAEVLEDVVRAVYASADARGFVKEKGLSGLMALGETTPGGGVVDVDRARRWLADHPDRYTVKKRAELASLRQTFVPPSAGRTLTYTEAIQEGAEVVQVEFGIAGGLKRGVDDNDGYDARDWEEDVTRERVVRAKVEPWLAFTGLLMNMGKDVPKAGGGTTKWSADCFEHARLIRIYAFWRTLSRHDFNARFSPLELGFFGASGRQINLSKQAILSAKPGDKPFIYDDTPTTLASGEIVMAQKRPLGKSWSQVLRDLPIGSHIVWTNADAYRQCTRNPSLDFCEAWRNENATKVGQDRYAAHPFGVIDEATIKRKMAEAVMGEGHIPRGYIEKNIYISSATPPL